MNQSNNRTNENVLPPSPMSLPLLIEEVTAEWVGNALTQRHPGTVVEDMRIDRVQPGTATKLRLLLRYAPGSPAALPPSMYLKAGLEGPEQLALTGSAFACEADFFNRWQPHLDINVPHCYFAATDPHNGQSALLLEDLTARGASFGFAPQALPVSAVARSLEQLARCHARWWRSPELAQLGPHPGILAPVADLFFSVEHWTRMLDQPRGALIPSPLRDRERMHRAMRACWQLSGEEHECFIHGDAHMGNLFFDADGQPGWLDWQGIMRGPWAHDVAYFIVGSLSVADRRAYERELLRGYLEQVASLGGPRPSDDEAWLRYRRHALHGFFWPLTPASMQPEDICAAQTERVCAALLDLETMDAVA